MIVLGQDQQRIVGETYPVPSYSRVFGLFLSCAAGIGEPDSQISPPIGNRVWLLGIHVHFMPELPVATPGCFLHLTTGQNPKATGEENTTRWENLIPSYGGAKKAIFWRDAPMELIFSMRVLFTGASRRFGVTVENFSATKGLNVNVFFEISEG